MKRLGAVAFVCAALLVWVRPTAAQDARPRCSTFNEQNEPSSSFEGGQKIVVRGTGYGSRSLVFVRFEQGSRTAELARAETNDLGAFAATDARVPDDVSEGKASIVTLDARGSATCEITLSGAAPDEGSDLDRLYLIWGSALALGALVLAVLTYRRWKSERLKEAMDSLSWRERFRARAQPHSDDAWELDPWERDAVDDDVAELDEPVPDEVTFPIGPGREDDEEWRLPVGDPPAEGDAAPAEEETDEKETVEPPVLPVGWDRDRVRPARPASDTIERLQREVRTWSRS